MKKIWIFVTVFVLIAFAVAFSQEIHWANQVTVEWDAPTLLIDGTPIPIEDVIAYNMYLRPDGATTEPVVGTTSELSYTYTLPEGVHEAGVSALRYIAGTGTPFESTILWSKDADPPFLLGFGRVTQAVTGFRVQ